MDRLRVMTREAGTDVEQEPSSAVVPASMHGWRVDPLPVPRAAQDRVRYDSYGVAGCTVCGHSFKSGTNEGCLRYHPGNGKWRVEVVPSHHMRGGGQAPSWFDDPTPDRSPIHTGRLTPSAKHAATHGAVAIRVVSAFPSETGCRRHGAVASDTKSGGEDGCKGCLAGCDRCSCDTWACCDLCEACTHTHEGVGCSFMFTSHRTDPVSVDDITSAVETQRLVLVPASLSPWHTPTSAAEPAVGSGGPTPVDTAASKTGGHATHQPSRRTAEARHPVKRRLQGRRQEKHGNTDHRARVRARGTTHTAGAQGRRVLHRALGSNETAAPSHSGTAQGSGGIDGHARDRVHRGSKADRALRVAVGSPQGRLGLSLLEQALTPTDGLHIRSPAARGPRFDFSAARTTVDGGPAVASTAATSEGYLEHRSPLSRTSGPGSRLRSTTHAYEGSRPGDAAAGVHSAVGGGASCADSDHGRDRASAVREANRKRTDAARRRRQGRMAAYARMAYA